MHPSNPTPSEATTASREDSSSDSAEAPGKPADKPAPTFDLLPLSAETRRALADVGYTSPTPVQLAVWEPATRGKDAVVQARTGTGKTASFALPIVDHLVRRSEKAAQVLVLTPTRELALQVSGEVERLGKYRETRVTAIYGGASMEKQIDAIKDGAQVICGTPGRVLDHIKRGTLPTASIRLLVLDEADEMLSMGFERELTAILESLPKARQTLLFSATVPPDIERISKSRLKDPEFLTLSGDHIGALEIQHFVYMVIGDKVGTLVRILESENPESAIIFCNTRDETSAVALALQQRGYDADWLNGDLPQSEREKVMTATRAGKLRFLVATDVAARGIDVSHVTHVINYDFPQDAEAYVHRTGRTGRAGRTGTAIALVTPQDIGGLYLLRLTYKIRPIERRIPSSLELKTRAETDMITALAESFLQKGTHPDDRALARRLITHDQAEGILAGLLREYLGPRPTAQEDASQARRATPRRASLRRRGEEPASERDAARPVSAIGEGTSHVRASDEGEAPRERHERSASDRGPRERPGREPRRDREGRHDRAPRDRHDRGPRHEGAEQPVRADGADRPARLEELAGAAAPAADALAAPTAVAAIAETPVERPRGRREDGRRDEPREGGAPRRERRGTPVAELANWQPPVDAGDDEPLLPKRPRETGARPAAVTAAREAEAEPFVADDAPYAELFIGVGRRDGVRAQDLLRALVEGAGLDKDHIRRIRVRDRHAFVAVRKDDATRAIDKLNNTPIADKATVTVELARERGGADEASDTPS